MLVLVPDEPAMPNEPVPIAPPPPLPPTLPSIGVAQALVLLGLYLGVAWMVHQLIMIGTAMSLAVVAGIAMWGEILVPVAACLASVSLVPVVAKVPIGSVLPRKIASRQLLCAVVLLGVAGGIVWCGIADGLARFAGQFGVNVATAMTSGRALLLGPAVAAFSEGMICRGVVQPAVARRHGPLAGVLWSALAFAILGLDLFGVIPRIPEGLLLGWIRLRAGVTGPCMIAQFSLAVFVAIFGFRFADPAVGVGMPWKVLVLGALVFVASVDWLARLTRAGGET